jgi:hypothetical protein
MSIVQIDNPSRLRALPPLAFAAGLIGSACLIGATVAGAQGGMTHHYGASHPTAVEARETVEDRITTLHRTLMITPVEEAKWGAVAQVMRANEAEMQRMLAERRKDREHELTAVEDLRTYERFNQAHVNGLKDLIAAFEVLYDAMPPSQQTVADGVFRHFGGHDRASRS